MTVKRTLALGLKIAALTLIMMALFMAGAALLGPSVGGV